MATKPAKTTASAELENFQVPALERALSILELLAQHADGMRMREIADHLDLPPNSVFRITGTLEDRGYLLRDGDDMRYRLSRKLLALGYAAIGEDKLIERAMESMRQLRDEVQETVLIGVRHELEGVVLEQVASNQPVKFLVDPGTRFPLHTSAPGKAILAFLPAAERTALLKKMTFKKYTANTLDTRAKVEASLEETRVKGFAIDRSEELEGLHCLGAPVFNHRGYPTAAIWVTGPSYRLPESVFDQIGKKVAATAERISRNFGYSLL
jgi:DNA-binding IclR family transcriptional regulator